MICVFSKGQISELADCDHADLTIIEGRGHESLIAAKKILAESQKTLSSFKAIFVVIRCPYDLMVSNYFFMRKIYKHNKQSVNFQSVIENNFADYSQEVGFAPIGRWMTIEGKGAQNLRIIRFENLQDDFSALAAEFGFQSIKLPYINSSSHDHYSKYLTKTS